MTTVRLEFSPTPAQVRTARLIAVAMARQCGVAEMFLEEVRLAVGEACSRAVGVHLHHELRIPIRVVFDHGERFTVQVCDLASGDALKLGALTLGELDLLSEPGSDFSSEESLTAGVGLALLRGFVDDLIVKPFSDSEGESGTVVEMSWPLGVETTTVE
jgi:anti-sigma regulatory factor (Ser/Thr protein kinase)